jgi:cob(I)alamin adenosyltransferase
MRFCKGNKPGYYGEIKFLSSVSRNNIHIVQYGLPRVVYTSNITQEDINEARDGWQWTKFFIDRKEYDLIILDEINICIDLKMIDIEDVKSTLKVVPSYIDIVLTGRNAHPDLIEMADNVTEIIMKKHYYNDGVQARKGIDY